MKDNLEQLRAENEKLRELSRRDSLTGLLSRSETEKQIDELARRCSGTLLILDFDGFKAVNDRYGHLQGDRVLISFSALLSEIFWKQDITGRIGGDEFVAYVARTCTEQMLEDKQNRLRAGLLRISDGLGILRSQLSVSIGSTDCTEGDTYCTMIDRADAVLMEKKRIRRENDRSGALPAEQVIARRSIQRDITRIHREMSEEGEIAGAYFQDYETFRTICRFVERGLRRSGSSAQVVLFTLTDREGNFIPLALQEKRMDLLHGVIRGGLRVGDLFARYSSGQYIVMLVGADLPGGILVAQRICQAFVDACPPEYTCYLQYQTYPMLPSGGKFVYHTAEPDAPSGGLKK